MQATQNNSSFPRSRELSSFSVFREAVEFCTRFLRPMLLATWPLLVVLQILELISDQYFDYVSEVIQRRSAENLLLLGGTAFLEFLSGLVFMAAWFLAIVPTLEILQNQRGQLTRAEVPQLGRSFRLHFNQLLIEQTRVFASVLWRLPFLLILSPLEYLRLLLVPYIVVLDPAYANGKVDALRLSRQIAKRHWLLLGSLALLTTLVPILIKQWVAGSGNIWIWENPWRVTINTALQFFANLLSSMLLFAVFKSLYVVSDGRE